MREVDPITGEDTMAPLSEAHQQHVQRQMSELDRKRAARLARIGTALPVKNSESVHGGVSLAWLAEHFNLDPKTVRKRLGECPPMGTTPQGPRYSLPQAAAYLVKPIFDVRKYLSTMKPEELPPQLQDQFWASMLKKQKWEENAGDLWRSDKVRDVFAEVFMTMKSAMQLWSESIERRVGLSTEQRAVLIAEVDGLQEEIHKMLVEGVTGEAARSSREEIEIEEMFFEDPTGGVI